MQALPVTSDFTNILKLHLVHTLLHDSQTFNRPAVGADRLASCVTNISAQNY